MPRNRKITLSVLLLTMVTLVVRAASVTISNASFESATLPFNFVNQGPFSNLIAGSTLYSTGGTLTNWTAASTTTAAAAGAFAPILGSGQNWSSQWWTGSNVGWLQISSTGSV